MLTVFFWIGILKVRNTHELKLPSPLVEINYRNVMFCYTRFHLATDSSQWSHGFSTVAGLANVYNSPCFEFSDSLSECWRNNINAS